MIKNALFGHFYLGTLMSTPFKMERGVKYRDAAKTSIIPVKNIDPNQELIFVALQDRAVMVSHAQHHRTGNDAYKLRLKS